MSWIGFVSSMAAGVHSVNKPQLATTTVVFAPNARVHAHRPSLNVMHCLLHVSHRPDRRDKLHGPVIHDIPSVGPSDIEFPPNPTSTTQTSGSISETSTRAVGTQGLATAHDPRLPADRLGTATGTRAGGIRRPMFGRPATFPPKDPTSGREAQVALTNHTLTGCRSHQQRTEGLR